MRYEFYGRMKRSEEKAILEFRSWGSGSTVAVENLPRTCLGKNSAEIRELMSVLGTPKPGLASWR